MIRFLRQSLVIARRDFMAIVFTPTFLLFLLGPLLMVGFATIGGLGAAHMAEGGEQTDHVVAILAPDQGARLASADATLRPLFGPAAAPPRLSIRRPVGDPAAQARAIFADKGADAVAVLHGTLEKPVIVRRAGEDQAAAYLAALARQALHPAGRDGAARVEVYTGGATTAATRQSSGFGAVFTMFFLTLLLAGQSVGMLAEEKGNKVIEIMASAIPLEAVFFGKLIGMFAVALLFIAFWSILLSQGLALLPGGLSLIAGIKPAVGMPAFAALFLVYFTLAFLLLGAVFLGVGAQAGTMREIQMLSLPITFFQVGMFGLASAAAANPASTLGLVARFFPFSSPFAMAARAATDPAIGPHLLAIAWQLLWVAITIYVAARLFRRGVLKSGGGGAGVRPERAEAAPARD
jgi:ABC-2 type transport system permease protein